MRRFIAALVMPVGRLVALLVWILMVTSIGHAQSVADGAGLYTSKGCSSGGCHAGGPAGMSTGHLNASNNPSAILAAIGGGVPSMAGIVTTAQQRLSLALYIGQQKVPSFTVANGNAALAMRVRSGATGTRDIYPIVQANGSGGAARDANGLATTSPVNGGTANSGQVGVTSTMQYNVTYLSPSQYAGTDSFGVTVASAAGTSASRTMNVTVLGITSVAAVQGVHGQTYPPGPGALYKVTSNDSAATNFTATPLPTGLVINAGNGEITGTPTVVGDVTVTVGATTASATESTNGTVFKTITISIAGPNAVPLVTTNPVLVAAPGVAGRVGQAITPPIQINATNTPINAMGYSATGLPPGLTLDADTGLITGTPTQAGDFDVQLGATNSIGTGYAPLVTIRISPSGVPAITSPTFATMAAGVAITPIQVVATNLPILSFSATSLPTGLSLDTGTGRITGTPTTPGVFTARISATNAAGPGPELEVPFTIGVPAPGACAMSVPLNTTVTLDLANCLFGGFAPTGVTIVATASHGTVVANGTRVTYAPVHNYFGTDSFSFVGSGAGGISPQGVVSVTVTGRPDPTQDAVVTAVIAAQSDTAQRFSRAQISNFQRRMESLHRRPGPAEGVASGLQQVPAAGGFAAAAALSAPAVSVANAVSAPLAPAFATGQGGMAAPGPVAAGPFPGPASQHGRPGQTISEASAIDAVATGMGLKALPFADSVFSLIRTRSVNLASVASGAGLTPTVPGSGSTSTNYWIEGVASFGTRDASGGFNGTEFSSNGISVGVDRRFGDQWALGMGVGYARDTTTIGTDGSSNKSKGYSLAVYGSYQPSPNTFIDGLLGVGSLDFDTKRFVAPINDFAFGQRSGTQVFGSLTGGYEFRDRDMLVSPYARLDFSTNRLRSSTESGAGAYALTYFGQTSSSVQGAMGVRGEMVRATSFGYAVPTVRTEYRHEFQGTGQAFVGYADQPGGPRYGLARSGTGRDSIVLGLGSDFILRDGLTLSLEYQLSHSFARDSSHALRFRLTKDFDARGLPRLLQTYPESEEEPLNLQVEAGASHDDNVTRAKSGPDRRSDDLYSVNISRTFVQPLTEQSRWLLTATLGGEKFHHFNGLSNLSASTEAEYQFRKSSDFDEPTLGAFAKLTAQGFESSLRDGYRLSLGVSIRQALTDRINGFAAFSHNRRQANSAVFDSRDNAFRVNFDYALSDTGTLYLGSEFRRGDIVSTGRPSLESVSIAKVFTQDDAYPGGQFFSYRFGGTTVLVTVGYNLVLGNKDSLDFSWRYVQSTPDLRPTFVTSPRSYKANQLSAVYLMRF